MAMEYFKTFVVTLSAAVILGVVSIALVTSWVCYYRGGFGWDGGLAEFNWHPVLNVAGFIFVQGIAIIVFRLPWTWKCSKLLMKFIHAGLNLLAFILAVVAVVSAFDFNNTVNVPHMYSLHSWLGLVAVVLYGLQLVLGVGMYLIPITPGSWRAAFMPLHVYGGLLLFGSVIAVALMGITEDLITNPTYQNFTPQGILMNVEGVLLVVFGALILWIATRTSWKRPSDQILHTLHTNEQGDDSSTVGPAMSQLTYGSDAEPFGDVRKRSYKSDDQAN